MKNILDKITKTPWADNGLTESQKLQRIEALFFEIMQTLGMDMTDDSLIDTPKRVAKMYVKEVFSGLLPENFPKITTVDNKFNYDQFVIEANITLNSNCEHHFIPILGSAHIAYKPNKKVIGLSKMNRLVEYFSKRPQIQERLNLQIMECMQALLETEDVAVIIDGVHTCVKTRGVKDGSSITRTSSLGGIFRSDEKARLELFSSIPKINEVKIV